MLHAAKNYTYSSFDELERFVEAFSHWKANTEDRPCSLAGVSNWCLPDGSRWNDPVVDYGGQSGPGHWAREPLPPQVQATVLNIGSQRMVQQHLSREVTLNVTQSVPNPSEFVWEIRVMHPKPHVLPWIKRKFNMFCGTGPLTVMLPWRGSPCSPPIFHLQHPSGPWIGRTWSYRMQSFAASFLHRLGAPLPWRGRELGRWDLKRCTELSRFPSQSNGDFQRYQYFSMLLQSSCL